MQGRAAIALAAIMGLAGCGAKLGEKTVSDTRSAIALADHAASQWGGHFAYETLARQRNLGDQVWRAPRPVEDGSPPPLGPERRLPAATLLLVEITQYPQMSCEGAAPRTDRSPPPERPTPGSPIDARELASLGAPTAVERLWMLAVDGVPYLGPGEWLGNFLREAGPGRAIHFPPFQDCGAMGESMPAMLPTRVFGRDRNVMRIGARTPFTARLVEACPATVTRRERLIRAYHIPLATWGYSIGFTRDRTLQDASVVGKCASGEARFELGPLAPLGGLGIDRDDPETLKVSLP